MKSILYLCVALSLLTLQSCQQDKGENAQKEEQPEPPVKQETPEKMIEELVGEWERAASGNNNQQEGAGQTLIFTQEARYIMRQGNQKTDSGAFRMNEQLRNLYLESDETKDAREYEIRLTRDTLILSAKENARQEGEQVYVRRN